MHALTVVLVLFAAGCTGARSATWVFSGGGSACVTTDDRGLTHVFVNYGPCWDCFTGTVECTAALVGTQLTVEAGGEVVVASECPSADECAPVEAGCIGPELPAGTYDLVYDGTTVQFVVPTTDRVCTP